VRHPLKRLAVAAAVALLCAGGAYARSLDASSAAKCGRFLPKEVAAANPSRDVYPVYNVPKCLPKKLLLAFANPGLEYPFFKVWDDAMKAAAKFYGVQFISNDMHLKFEDTVNVFNQLAIRHPAVVGTLTTAGDALKLRADSLHIPVLPIDIAIKNDPYYLGVPNEKAGMLGGKLVGKAVKDRMAGPWQGKHLIYVGLTNPQCEPCNIRVQRGVAGVRQFVSIDDKDVTQLDVAHSSQGDSVPGYRSVFADFLTAHPNDVMAVVALNDETGNGAYLAAKAANRTGDIVMTTLGADPLGREMLRENTGNMIPGEVDFNPWSEGWNWVAAAIAITRHEKYKPYSIDRIVTKQNVDRLFPGDKKK
jgi:ABC-type sugar transport system substrate-binding protein